MLSVEDMIGDMTSIHHQHLPRHSFIASIATLAMLKEAVASLTNGDLARIRTIDAGLKLPLNADPEGISSFLSREMCMKWANRRSEIEAAMNAHDRALFTQADANAAIGRSTATKPAPDAKEVVANAGNKLVAAYNELKQSKGDALAKVEAQKFVDRLTQAGLLERPQLKST